MINVVTIFRFGDIDELTLTVKSLLRQCENDFTVWFVLSDATPEDVRFLENLIGRQIKFNLIVNKDTSLYNAMNIALDNIKDGLVYFLNGGDVLAAENSLDIMNKKSSMHSCNWFSTTQTFDTDVYLREAKFANDGSFSPAHQGFVVARSLIGDLRFDEKLKIASDVYFMIGLHDLYGTAMHTDIIASMKLGGISNWPSFKTVKIRWKTQGLYRAMRETVKLCLRLMVSDKKYYQIMFNKMRLSNDKP